MTIFDQKQIVKHTSIIRIFQSVFRGVFFFFLFGFFLGACHHNTPSPVPEYPVYFEISLHSAQGKSLNAPGGYIYVTQPNKEGEQIGHGGLLILCSPAHKGAYYAYDLTCPHEVSSSSKLFVNEQFEAECSQCHSTFSILYGGGNPLNGLATGPLLCYKVIPTNGNTLVVTNR